MKTMCPACGHQVEMAYDAFEDMYRCPRDACWAFLYPEEVGRPESLTAGYRLLGRFPLDPNAPVTRVAVEVP